MYDNTRYSLARYSVNQPEKALAIEERFSESMGAMAGVAVPVDIRARFAEAVQGSARGTVSVAAALVLRDGLGAAVLMSANVLAAVSFAEAIQSSASGRKNLPAVLDAGEAVNALIWASKDIPTGLGAMERLNRRVLGSKNTTAAMMASEVLTSTLDAASQCTERAVFQLTIPPGGELRIDSELFTVLLNGENALHTQSGDWLSLSREMLKLTVESASGGGLEGQLIYTERYL